MEGFKVRSCILCFSITKDEDYEVIDSNSIWLLKLDLEDGKHVMCKVCSSKLFAAQKFKMTCLCTDNAINNYVGGTAVFPIDLRDIYMKERAKEGITDDEKVCRLCMEPKKSVSDFKLINEEEVEMILKFAPEMNIFIVKEPVICKSCLDSLGQHCIFLKQCSHVEQNIGNLSYEQVLYAPPVLPVDIPIKIEDTGTSVKIEVIDFEDEEDVPEPIKTEYLDLNSGIKFESVINGQDISEVASCKDQEMVICEKYDPETAAHMINKDSSKVEMYKCENCNYATNNKRNLRRHKLKHKDPSQMYKCNSCNYETRYKHVYKIHMLLHKDPSEVQMYKCENCNYETMHKYYLKRHMLKHKNPSEVNMYKCKHCDYEAVYKRYLDSHMLIHKDPSEVQMYKCEYCNYETKHKKYLKCHTVKHKDHTEVQMYKCENCTFQTKLKKGLKTHTLIHMSSSEVRAYKCETCDYETKYKHCLKKHMLLHEGRQSVQIYKCADCDFETKGWNKLTTHKLIHKDPSEVQMYKCENCAYESIHKEYLKRHTLIHKNASEAEMYKCETCSYKTNLEKYFKRHIMVHKDPSEVQMYKCEYCDYAGKHKTYLKRHMLTHKSSSEQVYKWEDCSCVTNGNGTS